MPSSVTPLRTHHPPSRDAPEDSVLSQTRSLRIVAEVVRQKPVMGTVRNSDFHRAATVVHSAGQQLDQSPARPDNRALASREPRAARASAPRRLRPTHAERRLLAEKAERPRESSPIKHWNSTRQGSLIQSQSRPRGFRALESVCAVSDGSKSLRAATIPA